MKTKLMIVSIVLVSFTLTSLAQEKPADCRHEKNKKECNIEGLTEQQSDAIKAIRTEMRNNNTQLKADLEIKKAELNKMLLQEKPAEKEIDKKIEEIGSIKTQIMKNKTHADIKIKAQLTPEQRMQYDMHHTKKGHKPHPQKNMQNKKMHKDNDCPHHNK